MKNLTNVCLLRVAALSALCCACAQFSACSTPAATQRMGIVTGAAAAAGQNYLNSTQQEPAPGGYSDGGAPAEDAPPAPDPVVQGVTEGLQNAATILGGS